MNTHKPGEYVVPDKERIAQLEWQLFRVEKELDSAREHDKLGWECALANYWKYTNALAERDAAQDKLAAAKQTNAGSENGPLTAEEFDNARKDKP